MKTQDIIHANRWLIISTALAVGFLLGTLVGLERSQEPIREACNEKIEQCNEQLALCGGYAPPGEYLWKQTNTSINRTFALTT